MHFNDYIDAIRLPKNTEEEITIRTKAMQDGMKKAIMVPLSVMKISDSCWDQMIIAARHGKHSIKIRY